MTSSQRTLGFCEIYDAHIFNYKTLLWQREYMAIVVMLNNNVCFCATTDTLLHILKFHTITIE